MDSQTISYTDWLENLTPRTCLLMHWLGNLGVVDDPGQAVRAKARRFAEKRMLLGRLVDGNPGELGSRTQWLIENGEFDIYVAWLMYLRFVEYVPQRFVRPGGRDRVLNWVRGQLKRPELNAEETVGELRYQIERVCEQWNPCDDELRRLGIW